jgi:hypothetical protein
MTTSGDSIPLHTTFGPGDGSFLLRFPPEYRAEIRALLDEYEISHDTVLELSAGVELAIEAVQVLGGAGGLAALASVYKTFANRHADKRVLTEDGHEVAGFSLKDTERLLEDKAKKQAEIDERWRQWLREQADEDDTKNTQ